MTRQELEAQIQAKGSFLCVGLDPQLSKLPSGINRDAQGVIKFCKQIIEASAPYCVAFKPNLAFFEALGEYGLFALREVIAAIPESHLVIADAKRGDIGNTSNLYAEAVYDYLNADAITVAPYMGVDSVTPFKRAGKWIVVLALTSNEGANNFQTLELSNGKKLYQEVIEQCRTWASTDELMFVAGATRATELIEFRKYAPDNFLLVPGYGAQGGSLKEVYDNGAIEGVGLLVNASRSVIYASSKSDFAKAAAIEASNIALEMKNLMQA